jgi:hypothetical protein
MRAARMLNDVIEKFLREHPKAGDSRVVVRIYADATNLSKQLAKTKLIGLEKRSIMPFAAGFTRAMGHFDFVDALDEEGTRFKIRGKLIKMKAKKQDAMYYKLYDDKCHNGGLHEQRQLDFEKQANELAEAFKLAAEDDACNHVLFAACHGMSNSDSSSICHAAHKVCSFSLLKNDGKLSTDYFALRYQLPTSAGAIQ